MHLLKKYMLCKACYQMIWKRLNQKATPGNGCEESHWTLWKICNTFL